MLHSNLNAISHAQDRRFKTSHPPASLPFQGMNYSSGRVAKHHQELP